MDNKNDHGTVKHITLSTDRPNQTKPYKIFVDWTSQKNVSSGYLKRQQAMSLIEKYIKESERRPKQHRNDLVGDKTPAIGSDENIYSGAVWLP
jgi:hypothetical protein